MSTVRKIFGNTLVQVAGKVVTGLLGVVTIKLLTGYFDKGTFGDYTVVFEFLAFFGIVADMGLFTIAVREMSKPGAVVKKVLGNVLGIRMSLASLALGAAVVTAFLMPKYGGQVEMGILVSAFSMMAAFAAGSVSTVLQTEMKMQWQALGLILGKIVTVTLIAAGVIFSQKFLWFMGAGLVGNLVYMSFTIWFVSKIVKVKLEFDWDYWKELLKTALPYGLALILGTIYFRVDSVMLYQMVGREATATYGVAVKALEILTVVPIFFLNSTLPTLTRYIHEGSEKLKRLLQLAFDFLGMTGLGMAGGVVMLAVPLVLFFARPEYVDAALPLQILMGAMLASFLNSLFGYVMVATNNQVKLLIVNLVCVGINVGANLWAIPKWSFVGAAVTSIISEVFVLMALGFLVMKILKVKISLWPFLKMLMGAGLMMGALWFLPRERIIDLTLTVPVGGLIFVGWLFLTKTFDKNLVMEILKLKKN